MLKSILIFTPFAFLLVDVMSWWLTKWYPGFAIFTIIGGVGYSLASTIMLLGTLALSLSFLGSAPTGEVKVAMLSVSIVNLTTEWTGDRTPDGRPKVSDQLLERLNILRVYRLIR